MAITPDHMTAMTTRQKAGKRVQPSKLPNMEICCNETEEAVEIVSEEPLFETGLLLAGDVDQADLRRQLSRWTRSGRIHRLRRGLYVLEPPWRKRPRPFLVANRLAPGS